MYGDGRSERLIGRVLAGCSGERPFVATKMGRRVPQEHAEYTPARFREWNDRSRENLGVERIDLVQLHGPPTAVIEDDALFAALDDLIAEGRIGAYGVSVETCDQVLTAIARPGVATVQIILNAFRLKPIERVLPAARAAGVGIIARVPLASGLLSGRYDSATTFTADDHRTYNRHGESFDAGETFSGVDFETGLEAVRRLAPLVPAGASMAQWALRFVLDQPGVSVVIPGARNAEQAAQRRCCAAAAFGRRPRGRRAGLRRAHPAVRARPLVVSGGRSSGRTPNPDRPCASRHLLPSALSASPCRSMTASASLSRSK